MVINAINRWLADSAWYSEEILAITALLVASVVLEKIIYNGTKALRRKVWGQKYIVAERR